MFGFLEMLMFVVLILAGFFFIWKKGVLDWAHSTTGACETDDRPPGSDSGRVTAGGTGAQMIPESLRDNPLAWRSTMLRRRPSSHSAN